MQHTPVVSAAALLTKGWVGSSGQLTQHVGTSFYALLRQLRPAGYPALWQDTSLQAHIPSYCSCSRAQHSLGSVTELVEELHSHAGQQHQQSIQASPGPSSSHGLYNSYKQSSSAGGKAAAKHSRSSTSLAFNGAAAGIRQQTTQAAAQAAAVHAHRYSQQDRNNIRSKTAPTGYMAARAALRQVPDAPGTPARPGHAPHIAARHHLQQYLASIERMGFVEDLAAGIQAGNRLAISRALTLCESTRPDHALQAAALLRKLVDNKQQQPEQHIGHTAGSTLHTDSGSGQLQQQSSTLFQQLAAAAPAPHPALQSGVQSTTAAAAPGLSTAVAPGTSSSTLHTSSLRVGLSGPPGAGKSSLIETWGCYLADHGSKVAVLAVDPSSVETGGAILGDKTRMARLSSHPNAFVRPSPARGTLGGVSRATYDAMVICEAAGYEKVLVETVGVGQSEVAVADLVDCMLLVMPPVGGDDLQMIKRGIMEVADVVLVNKADGATEAAATRAAAEYGGCLHLMPHRYHGWSPQVLAVSAHTGKGVPALARLVTQFQEAIAKSGELEKSRIRRAEAITWLSLEEQLLEGIRQDPHTRALLARLMPCVRAGTMAPRSAADIALSYFYQHCA